MGDTCPAVLHMYDGEYEGDCDLPEGHDGPHWDCNTSWRTDDSGTDYDTIDLPEDRALFIDSVRGVDLHRAAKVLAQQDERFGLLHRPTMVCPHVLTYIDERCPICD